MPSLSLPSGCPPDCLAMPFQPFCLCSSSPVVYCCYRLCFMYTAAQPQLVFRHAVQFQCFSCLLNLPSLPFPDCHPCLACYPAALLLSVPLFSFLASFLAQPQPAFWLPSRLSSRAVSTFLPLFIFAGRVLLLSVMLHVHCCPASASLPPCCSVPVLQLSAKSSIFTIP